MHDILATLSTSTAADALRGHAPQRLMMRGIRPVVPVAGAVAGKVRTLRYLPARADLTLPALHARTRVLDALAPGEILVVQAIPGGMPVIGDLTGLRAHQAGAAAVITDGTVRDTADIRRLGLPLFAGGLSPALTDLPDIPWEYDTPIACGGVTVLPGDWLIADADGVLVVPPAFAPALAEAAPRLLAEEAFSKALLNQGHRIADAYPIPARLRPAFEAWRQSGVLPAPEEVRGAAPG